jgi:uncharacterized protein
LIKIGLLSDTHGFLHPKVFESFSGCDEIWHAGDIGNSKTAKSLMDFKPLRAVSGNIDGRDIRVNWPETDVFMCEQVKVAMIHIGGYPGRYEKQARRLIEEEKPDLFIAGHSHILKVVYDKKYRLLYINPGAAGIFGMHLKITLVRFAIDTRDIFNLEVIELDRKI